MNFRMFSTSMSVLSEVDEHQLSEVDEHRDVVVHERGLCQRLSFRKECKSIRLDRRYFSCRVLYLMLPEG